MTSQGLAPVPGVQFPGSGASRCPVPPSFAPILAIARLALTALVVLMMVAAAAVATGRTEIPLQALAAVRSSGTFPVVPDAPPPAPSVVAAPVLKVGTVMNLPLAGSPRTPGFARPRSSTTSRRERPPNVRPLRPRAAERRTAAQRAAARAAAQRPQPRRPLPNVWPLSVRPSSRPHNRPPPSVQPSRLLPVGPRPSRRLPKGHSGACRGAACGGAAGPGGAGAGRRGRLSVRRRAAGVQLRSRVGELRLVRGGLTPGVRARERRI